MVDGAEAYFDTWGPGAGRSFRFAGCVGTAVARTLDEVVPTLEAVEEAVSGGLYAAGYIAYEAAGGLDDALQTQPAVPGLPLVWFGLFERRVEGGAAMEGGAYKVGSWVPSLGSQRYIEQLAAIRQRIRAGDTYQVNFTWRLAAAFDGDARAFYRDLCRSQRSPYCAYLDIGPFRVLSASPELFFRVEGDEVTMRPMKGTRPRGRWPAEDEARARALDAAAKDRAENAMIVDLLRNDLGRIARTGSVEVPQMWQVERYETVWQMTSTVRARRREGIGLTGLMRALFPCGSVTGAPKVSTMGIIRGLEESPRGVYTGSIGYVEPSGDMQFNVAIRTVCIDVAAGRAEYGVGGGVTWASKPMGEYRECLDKARILTHRRPEFRLIETLLYEAGKGYFLRQRHLRRLAASARYFGFAYDVAAVDEKLDGAVGGGGDWRVRLLLDREGDVEVEATPYRRCDGAWTAALAAERVDPNDVFLYHKTTYRRTYERGRASVPGCDEAILRNRRGELTECTVGNLVLAIDGHKYTPPLRCGLLPGTFRAELLARGEVAERVLRRRDLLAAEQVFMINALRRWVPLRLDGGPDRKTFHQCSSPNRA